MKKWINLYLSFALIGALFVASRPTLALAGPTVNTNEVSAYTDQASTQSLALGESGVSYRYVATYGITGEPYPVDGDHLNTPAGLFVDGSDNLYVAEINADRVLRYDSEGNQNLAIGQVGAGYHHDNFLYAPRNMAVDADGNIWVVIEPAIKEFDPDGNLIQIFPETDPWNGGSDNDRFNSPRDVAFDSAGLMYVADSGNQRIQIYDVSGETPAYVDTIGETGVTHTDNLGFNWPRNLAFDSSGRLYVSDQGNFRIQRCTYSTEWTCETFFGVTGESGLDPNHLSAPSGMAISGNIMYLADGGGHRVLSCDLDTATCANFAGVAGEPGDDNDHLDYPMDVAVDSSGQVYVAEWDNFRVQVFDIEGVYQKTYGTTGEPYAVDDSHLNWPAGVQKTNDGGLLVVENSGSRLIKYDSNMNQQWTKGTAGISWLDDSLNYPEGNAVQDSLGRIFLADTSNNDVRIYSANGTLIDYLGERYVGGDDNGHFNYPTDVAISPLNQDILVVDKFNQRIQVFSSNLAYKATLGVTGMSDTDNAHFTNPSGVAVNSAGNVFVADTDNKRVQKCVPAGTAYNCATFAGETGIVDDAFNHMNPLSVAIGPHDWVYVSDRDNNRVQVFDTSGAYLTTVGGNWGILSGQLTSNWGIDVDADGTLYIADTNNDRIQVYALGVDNWTQANINGFGDRRATQVNSFVVYGNYLYAGVKVEGDPDSGQVWRTSDGQNWQKVGENMGNGVSYMINFKDLLYLGSQNGDVWVTSNGTTWTNLVSGGFNGSAGEINRFEVFGDQLYASVWDTDSEGVHIWRTPDGTHWTEFGEPGFGNSNNVGVISSEVFDDWLYYGTANWSGSGAQIWRTDGSTWEAINTDGLGNSENMAVTALEAFNGYLYAGLGINNDGIEVQRTPDGTHWETVVTDGFDEVDSNHACALKVVGNRLYLLIENDIAGLQIYQTKDGSQFEKIAPGGFGDSNNSQMDWGNSTGVFKGALYVGTHNFANGGEIWRYGNSVGNIFLPLVLR